MLGLLWCDIRSDGDAESYWMSGHPSALFFWVLQRHALHGEPELRKVAGEYQARVSASVIARQSAML